MGMVWVQNKEESPGTLEIPGLSLAEKERFELSNRFTGYTISSRAPSTKLGDFSMSQALPVNMGYFTTGEAARQAENFIFLFLHSKWVTPRGLDGGGGME